MNKFMLFASIFWLNMINIAPAQESKPEGTAKDAEIREQTQQNGAKISASLKENYRKIIAEKARLDNIAINRGKSHNKRFQQLISRFEYTRLEVEQLILEAESINKISPEKEAQINSGILEMESLLISIEKEIDIADPGNPKKKNGKT
jgi:hypothetical protein